jgi:hypothetical protein
MNSKTVEQAARLIAPRVDLCFPQHKDKLYEILSLINQHVWKKGKFRGMTKEFFTKVDPNGFVCNPHGYDILLKVNLNKVPVTIRSEYFQFHRNGNGSQTECCGKDWSTDVVDRGFSPVIFQPYKEESCSCKEQVCQKIKIGIRSEQCEEGISYVTVYGCYPDGTPIYSYRKKDSTGKVIDCVPCDPTQAQLEDRKSHDVKEGVDIPITGNVYFLDNIYFGEIRQIRKPPTYGAVEVLALNEHDNSLKLIARMEPPHCASCYRRWQIPPICSKFPCVHGLWKISKPGKVIYDNQLMLIDDDAAIIALAKGINFLYYRDNPEEAVKYFSIGMTAINDDSDEHDTEAFEEPIQNRDVSLLSMKRKTARVLGY